MQSHLVLTLLLLALCAPLNAVGTAAQTDLLAEVASSALVAPELVEALATHEQVGVRVYYLEPEGYEEPTDRSTMDREPSPVLIDLASAFLPGEISLVDAELVRAVRGLVNTEIVRGLIENPSVVGIEIDAAVQPGIAEPLLSYKACSPSSTRACVQSNRFSIEVILAGANARVAASSSQSAVFWRYGSSNWEVVAKVLNGCPVNNHWWVFAAGATGSNYQVRIFDFSSGGSIAYFGQPAFCPVQDTGQFNTFPCP